MKEKSKKMKRLLFTGTKQLVAIGDINSSELRSIGIESLVLPGYRIMHGIYQIQAAVHRPAHCVPRAQRYIKLTMLR